MYWRTIFFLYLAALAGSCAQRAADETEVIGDGQPIYTEKYRPQFHFSPPNNWMNDPNGMVFFEGEYHLFYQYYPDSNVWGPMHWGHAVSLDMVRWDHLPIALYPDELGYIFSGSAVIDWKNTSGFGKDGKPPMIAIFTHHSMEGEKAGSDTYQVQSIAYSNDRGRSWTKYDKNPVVENPGIKDFRDPKVIWHEASQRWVMVFAALDRLRIYTSPDLKSWEYSSEFGADAGNHGGVWECPDLFPLTAPDGTEKWVLIQSINPGGPNGGSATQYFIGDFDGQHFTNAYPKETELWLDYGKDNYAGVTFSDVPNSDVRRYFIGWMSNWEYAQVVPTTVWRSAMTIPRKLELIQTKVGLRIATNPVRQLNSLRLEAVAIGRADLSREFDLMSGVKERTGLYEIHLEFQKPKTGRVQLEFFNSNGELLFFGYDVEQNEYFIDRISSGKNDFSEDFAGRHVAPCYYNDQTIKMVLYMDRSSLELFADDGKTVMTEIFFPNEPFTDLMVKVDEAPLRLEKARIYSLKGIW